MGPGRDHDSYKDARDYFSKNLADLSQAALTMYGTVAASFSEAVTRRYGVTCLHLLLIYKAAAELKLSYEEPGGTVIEVPAEHVALADQYQEAVTNRFPQGVVIKVEVRNQKGDSVLDIKGIPVEQVDTLVEALMDELPAAPELLPPRASGAAGGAGGDLGVGPGGLNGSTALRMCRGVDAA